MSPREAVIRVCPSHFTIWLVINTKNMSYLLISFILGCQQRLFCDLLHIMGQKSSLWNARATWMRHWAYNTATCVQALMQATTATIWEARFFPQDHLQHAGYGSIFKQSGNCCYLNAIFIIFGFVEHSNNITC